MIYVVLGMHKSGTTLVSQILHKSGISMGDEFDESVSYDQGNQWERRESWLINLDLVGCAEPDYFSLDHWKRVVAAPSEPVAAAMDALIARCDRAGGDWGFKDPLTCITYRSWRSRLPAHRLVCVYRSPQEVMRHYGCRWRDPVRAWRVLRAWTSYNQGILDALELAGDGGLLVRYEALMNGDAEFHRLAAFTGRALTDMRRASSYRAKSGHPLHAPESLLMGAVTNRDPRRVLRQLDGVRAAQLRTAAVG